MLESQKVRQFAPEMDSLRLGMGWSLDRYSRKADGLLNSLYSG